MQISQIYITENDTLVLPKRISDITSSIGESFPGSTHIIYNNRKLREFIAENFPNEVVRAYDTLIPYAYKADLGRYCLLYQLGGWYIDIAVKIIMQPKISSNIEWICFRDSNRWTNSSWTTSNALIYSTPKNNILRIAIEKIIVNCRQKYYGVKNIDPTGPSLLGQAVASSGTNTKNVIGDILSLTPTHSIRNRAFVLPDGNILAWAKPWLSNGPVELSSLGAEGTNDYKEMWMNRNIYDLNINWSR